MNLLLMAVWLSAVAAAPADEIAADSGPLALPITVERLWYRSNDKRRLFNRPGDLTITDEALEFAGRKKTVTVPLGKIHVVSFGKMRGDVDTDWAVLGIGDSGALQRIGFRDGAKLGYGRRTNEVFETLKRVLRQTSAAQYRVAEGFRTFEEIEFQCTLAVPDAWDTHADSLVFVDGRPKWGTILFSTETLRREVEDDEGRTRRIQDQEAIGRARAGDVPAFFLERSEVGSGMSCEEISPKARAAVLQRVSEDALFDRGGQAAAEPQVTDVTVDGCVGLRIVSEGRRADGEVAILEAIVAAHADTLFLIGVRAVAEHVDRHRATFAEAVSSLRFSAAR